MPKGNSIVAAFAALVLGLLPGCAGNAESPSSPESSSESPASSAPSDEAPEQESATEEDRFVFTHGSFELAHGWYKYDDHSTEAKPFFVPKDYDGTGIPDIISVKHGTNHYSKDDPTTFGRAITAQLARQVQGIATVEVTASGITSDMGDPVLVFDIPTKDCQITQYYICGDHEHILVYESNSVDQKSAMRSPRQS
jgi:hypothetical protein